MPKIFVTLLFQVLLLLFINNQVFALNLKILNKTKFNESNILFQTVPQWLCFLDPKLIHVYFENYTSTDIARDIVKGLHDCRIPTITLRYNRKFSQINRTLVNDRPLYMLMIINNAFDKINLDHLQKESIAKYRSFYIVIIENAKGVNNLWLIDAFESFWNKWMLNVVIIFWKKDIEIYKYSPFSTEFLQKFTKTPQSKEDLFPSTTINMNKKPLHMIIKPDEVRAVFPKNGKPSGADVYMADLIANEMNAKKFIKLRPMNDNLVEALLENEVDIVINTRFLDIHELKNKFETTLVYGRDDICVLVPNTGDTPFLLNIFRAFNSNVWFIILVVIFTAALFLKIVAPKYGNILINIFQWNLNNPASKVPKRQTARVFLGFWLIYSLLIASAYRGNLTTNLVIPIPLPDIDTISALAKANYNILIYDHLLKFLHIFSNSSSLSELNHLNVNGISFEEYNKLLHNNNISFAYMNKHHITSFRALSSDHIIDGKRVFHHMKTCLIPFYVVYIVPLGSPYLGSFNNILRKAQEHGIIVSWEKYVDILEKVKGKKIIFGNNDSSIKILQLVHLQSSFFILGIGLVLAFIVFLLELF